MLNEIQIEEIRRLAQDKRQFLGFMGDIPIANDVFTILDKQDIILLEYPVKSDGDRPAFSAAIMYFKEDENELVFIGLNTSDYYDKQLFAVIHELYHYYTKSGSHLSRVEDEENSLLELKANRFAAEFFLPEITLKGIVLDEFKKSSLEKNSTKTILRFIARLHCTWWLPYRSLVKRLLEIKAISKKQHDELYKLDERNFDSEYGRIGLAVDKDIFCKLNNPTYTIGTSAKDIETIIRNFENNLIDEDMFYETLSLFGKSPDDFGYNIIVSDEDQNEMNAFFNQEDEDEN